jgi:6-phosphogluconolactonase (cycloisomerase 2 family)
VVLRHDGRVLYAVNAGSDDITAFRVRPGGLDRLGVYATGDQPVSIAVHRDLLFVLYDGATPGVSGFHINRHGALSPIAGSERLLPTGSTPDAAQVGFSPDGRRLVVTAKATGELVTWKVRRSGLLGDRTVSPSSGATPFGFAFDRKGFLYVTEAFGGMPDAAAVSSYARQDGGWSPEVASLPTTETATCWIAITPNGRFGYVTNTGSASVSGIRVGQGGAISLLDSDGVTGTTGMTPVDLSITRSGRYLYTLNAGAHSLSAFEIGSDGSLTHLGDTGGLPAGANGLAAE